ncbi:MAG: molecular chaperone HtpG [Ruminococcaceae bacterium]|nr:molecular chaperone HtpG [Oscillospiraceae bacterium]
MEKKAFKTESKKMLDMMINSIYTHKEIFLRELISNASDAIDKRAFRALTESSLGLDRSEYKIEIIRNKEENTITIRDNGCGMTQDELENNLGTIAKSGSLDFKNENGKQDGIDIIGQFGVGFYSAFMVSDKITVKSRAIGTDCAYVWESEGADGYTIAPCDYASFGSEIVLHIKPDTEEEKYSEFLDEYRIRELIKKYSDYIRYPIVMNVEKTRLIKNESEDAENANSDAPKYETYEDTDTLNSMVPIWHKSSDEVTEEEYASFYREKFYDYEAPAKVIRSKTEGTFTYETLLFIPKRAPYNYYSKDFEKGLQLYSAGVMIMEKCADLLPDYFNFVKGLVDSEDLSLNISREMLQHDHQLKAIAKSVEKKIKNELLKMLENDREKYEEFFKEFGSQLKYGIYSDFGKHKDVLQDLLMFKSSEEKKYVTLKEYVSRMKEEQKSIYYACGDSVDLVDMLPKTEAVKAKGYEVLYLTENIDEFALRTLMKYDDKEFINVCDDKLDISTDEEKEQLKAENESAAELLAFMKESIGEASVTAVKFTNTLKDHPVCLSSEGGISTEMEKVLSQMPGSENAPKAETVLEINGAHAVATTLKGLFATGEKEKVASYAKILYTMARLISGLPVENPTELSNMICDLM